MLQSKTKFIAAVIYLASFCESQVTLDLCHPIIFGNFCQLRCETPDLTQDVVFRKDGTEYVSCKVAFGISQCLSKIGSGYTIAQSSSQPITYVNITQVSRAQDDGVWTCEYGPSARDSKNFTVFSEPSGVNTITGDTSLNYCNGNSTDSYITVQFTVPCCSEVDIKAVLANSAGDGLTRELVVSQGPACSDIKENTYSAEFNITKFELHNGPYSLSFKTQLTGNYGQEYETKSTSSYMFSCPTTVPPTISTSTTGMSSTTPTNSSKQMYITVGIVAGAVIFILVGILIFVYVQKKRKRSTPKISKKVETNPGVANSEEVDGKDLENMTPYTDKTPKLEVDGKNSKTNNSNL